MAIFDHTCHHCGVKFQHRKKDKKYCSFAHYQAHKKQKQPKQKKICKWCDKEFEVAYRFRAAKYCSKPCSNSGTKQKRVGLDCQECGIHFEVIPYRIENGAAFCSYDCFAVNRRGGEDSVVKLVCENCGKEFEKSYIQRDRAFCSYRCSNQGEHNGMY